MKRFRVVLWDFDTSVRSLIDPIDDNWEPEVKEMHRRNREQVEARLVERWGSESADQKRQNFVDLGPKEFSIIAFHNRFFQQARSAFVVGAYYPALAAACALGERILNHLIISLRDDFIATPEYKKVYRKSSFDDWLIAINTLEAWGVLLPDAVTEFKDLMGKRHSALHFRPETDRNDRQLALDALQCLQRAISAQFAGLGPKPWYCHGIPGEVYIKKDWEAKPFVRRIVAPSCRYVGPLHEIQQMFPKVVIDDNHVYEDREVTDDEFAEMRRARSGPTK